MAVARQLAIFGAAVATALAFGAVSAPLAGCSSSCLTIAVCDSYTSMTLLGLTLTRGAHYELEVCRSDGCSLVDVEIQADADDVREAKTTRGTIRVGAHESKPDYNHALTVYPMSDEFLESLPSEDRWDLTLRDADRTELARRSFKVTAGSCKESCGDRTYHVVRASPLN